MTAKHEIGATVTACSQEKKPNHMPAKEPNAKCGNRAVPSDTGYIAPSSAWIRPRMTTATPPMTQAMIAAGPAACAAKKAPNDQPEPMIERPDAQTAPMNPTSRLRPTSAGRVSAAEPVSVAMIDSSFLVSRSCPEGRTTRPAGSRWERVRSVVQSEEHRRDHLHT